MSERGKACSNAWLDGSPPGTGRTELRSPGGGEGLLSSVGNNTPHLGDWLRAADRGHREGLCLLVYRGRCDDEPGHGCRAATPELSLRVLGDGWFPPCCSLIARRATGKITSEPSERPSPSSIYQGPPVREEGPRGGVPDHFEEENQGGQYHQDLLFDPIIKSSLPERLLDTRSRVSAAEGGPVMRREHSCC
ncbi:unnamed protein product [Boreogadus saida]